LHILKRFLTIYTAEKITLKEAHPHDFVVLNCSIVPAPHLIPPTPQNRQLVGEAGREEGNIKQQEETYG
jgi:hypothetical protein